MPPRPNSPRISYLPALVAVTILFSRTDVRPLASTFSPISAEVNPPSELVFRSRHGRSCGSVSLVLRDQLLLSSIAGHLPSGHSTCPSSAARHSPAFRPQFRSFLLKNQNPAT